VHVRSTVTVGSDGSRASLEAVGWASEYARLWEASLRIVTVGSNQVARGPVDDSTRQLSREEFQSNQRLERRSRAALSRALGAVPRDRVDTRVVTGDPVEALVRAAEQGPLVVGTRRLGFLAGAIAGSVSRRVIGRAGGPVTVVSRTSSQRRRRIVAGVDGGASTHAVVSYAFEEARVRGAELVVCRAAGEGPGDDRSAEVTAAAIEGAGQTNRDVRVRAQSRRGGPGRPPGGPVRRGRPDRHRDPEPGADRGPPARFGRAEADRSGGVPRHGDPRLTVEPPRSASQLEILAGGQSSYARLVRTRPGKAGLHLFRAVFAAPHSSARQRLMDAFPDVGVVGAVSGVSGGGNG
jgi:nucleotide-binding universal stress UspA family protein